MDEAKEILALAKSFFDALEQGDVSILRKVYAPNVEIWHNTDGLVQTLEENETTLKGFVSRISHRKYDQRRTEAFRPASCHALLLLPSRSEHYLIR